MPSHRIVILVLLVLFVLVVLVDYWRKQKPAKQTPAPGGTGMLNGVKAEEIKPETPTAQTPAAPSPDA